MLTSGAANDTYLFEDNWGVDTIVDAGGTNDKLDFSAVTSNITATLGSLQVTSGANRVQGNSSGAPVEGIEDIVAGTGVDTLISTAVVGSGSFNTWTLNGVGSGNINGLLQFSRFENLTGGAPDDRFVFTGGSLTGAIDGGAGTDTLDYSSVSQPVTVNRATSTAPLIATFSHIENVKSGTSSTDLLIGANSVANWSINGINSGSIDNNFQFSSFENLTGGNQADKFSVAANGSLTGKLLGSAGADHVDLSGKLTSLTTTIQGLNRGRVVDSNQSLIVDFDSVENVTGGGGNDFIDHFIVEPLAGLNGKLDGGGGNFNHLDYSQWSTPITVNLTNGTNQTEIVDGTVAGIENITGGTAGDTLTGNASGNRIIGGGGADTIDGHYGNAAYGDVPDDNATDILAIDGTSGDDTILIGTITTAGADFGKAGVRYYDHQRARFERRHRWPEYRKQADVDTRDEQSADRMRRIKSTSTLSLNLAC